jgi:TolA-binding protein
MSTAERPCPDDLVMRGQRGLLSQVELRALDAHLAQCPTCRATSAVARLFDAIPDAQPGDELLIARVASRATRGREGLGRRRWLQVAAAVLVALGSSVATAMWLGLRRQEPAAVRPAEPASPPRRDHRPLPSRATPAEAPPAPAAPASPAPVARPEARSRRQAALTVEAPPQPRDAAARFAQANAVRRNGELARAIGLYRALRLEFPESSHALVASLSLGDLLLGLGDPTGALAAYDAYLAHRPAGSLTEEALFGRTRCLARLHRQSEERRTWEELVRRYPRSAYRPAAERRLAELGR